MFASWLIFLYRWLRPSGNMVRMYSQRALAACTRMHSYTRMCVRELHSPNTISDSFDCQTMQQNKKISRIGTRSFPLRQCRNEIGTSFIHKVAQLNVSRLIIIMAIIMIM